jgi:hypothetical protein
MFSYFYEPNNKKLQNSFVFQCFVLHMHFLHISVIFLTPFSRIMQTKQVVYVQITKSPTLIFGPREYELVWIYRVYNSSVRMADEAMDRQIKQTPWINGACDLANP